MIAVLGAFDGFHTGHALLFDRARSLAADPSDWAVVTFSPHPDTVISGATAQSLFTEEERDYLARFFGIPRIIKIPFDMSLAKMPPDEFIVLLESLMPLSGVVVGEDYRFGGDRAGDAEFLRALSHDRRWAFNTVKTLSDGAEKVSSSRIRRLVQEGSAIDAKRLLGYPFFFRGRVIHGDGRGRTLGYPTANVLYGPEKTAPRRGVYAASVLLDGDWRPGALNIGCNPTFLADRRPTRFETYILDFEGSLYGKDILVFIESHIRQEVTFHSAADLVRRMGIDSEEARSRFIEVHAADRDLYRRLAAAFF